MTDYVANAMDEVLPGLWIGDLTAATDEALLREKNIHSVLSTMRGKVDVARGFRHVHVDLDDTEVADALALFPQCIDFVEGELAKGRGVLVHCHLGMSRSATIVAAYLMYTQKHDAQTALGIIKKVRPVIEPNPGFLRQLDVFYQASYVVSNTNKVIRLHYLKSGVVLPSITNDGTRAADVQGLGAMSSASSSTEVQTRASRPRRIRCKLCRKEVATRDDFMDHSNGHGRGTTNTSSTTKVPMIGRSCSGYFIEPLPWTQEQATSGAPSGKLACPTPRCNAKLGNFDWAGSKCGCGEWVVPGFCLARGKVDECP